MCRPTDQFSPEFMRKDFDNSFDNFLKRESQKPYCLEKKRIQSGTMHACLRLHQCVRAIVLQALDMSILTLPLCGMRSSQHDSVMLEATSQIQSFCFHSLWTASFKSRATVLRKLYDSDVVLPVERVRNHLDVRSG